MRLLWGNKENLITNLVKEEKLMSANIYWRPVKTTKNDIGIWSPSAFIETFNEAFGPMPRVLSETDLPVLYGIKAAFAGVENKTAIQCLIDALEKGKAIEVFAEY